MTKPRLSILVMFFIFSFTLYAADKPKKTGSQIKEGSSAAVKATFVELGSVNCTPCKMMKPVMADIEKNYGGRVKVIFYDVWKEEGRPYAEQYKIRAIPTQVFLDKDGKEFFRHEGFFPTEEIAKVLDKQGIKQLEGSTKMSGKSGGADTKMQSGEVCK